MTNGTFWYLVSVITVSDAHYTVIKTYDEGEIGPTTYNRGKAGVAVLLRNNLRTCFTALETASSRLVCIHLKSCNRGKDLILFNVYMPSGNGSADIVEYNDILAEIDNMITQYPNSTVVIGGDFNADLSLPRNMWKTKTRLLHLFMEKMALATVSRYYGTESKYTYCSDNGVNRSHIDMFIARTSQIHNVQGFCIVPEDPMNTSDHLPIQVTLEWKQENESQDENEEVSDKKQNGQKFQRIQVKWSQYTRKDIEEKYTKPLEDNCKRVLDNLIKDELTPKQLEQVLNNLSADMCKISTINLESSSGVKRKHQKHEWDTKVDAAYKKMKMIWRNWKHHGRKKKPSNRLWNEYKAAKRTFRATLRRSRRCHELSLIRQIESARKSDTKLFYKLIKQSRTQKVSETDTLIYQDKKYDGKAVLQGFKAFFSDLAKPDKKHFQQSIIDSVQDIANSITPTKVEFTMEELNTAIQKLKRNKAPGFDNVSAEHVIFSGNNFRRLLLFLLNSMLSCGHIPESFLKGIIIPIHKGKGKSVSDPGSYRGITLSTTFCKIVELLLKPTIIQCLEEFDVPDELQHGFQENHSCSLTAISLNFIVEDNSKCKRTTYTAFLDAARAFDTVWHEGLMYKLYHLGVTGMTWYIIYKLYSGMKSAVCWNNKITEWFPVEQGVRQGGILSPLLYLVYIDGLIKRLRNSGAGCSTMGRFVGTLVLADDVVLIANSPQELNQMLEVVHSYATHWHYSINPTKSAVVIFNHDNAREKCTWKFGKDTIPEKESHPHLGIQRASTRINNRCHNIMQNGSKTLYSLTGSGAKRRGLSPPILAALWETYCIPRMLYGVEITNLHKGEKATLDKYQNQVFKNLLGLPKSTSSAAINLLTGLAPMSTCVDLLHLRLLGKLLLLPHTRLESRLFHHILCQYPQSLTLKKYKTILQQYNLPDVTESCGEVPTYQMWKRKISLAARQLVTTTTCREVQERSSLFLFNGVNPAHIQDIFPTTIDPPHLREAITIKAQLLTGTYLTRSRLHKISKDVQDPQCLTCKAADETVTHFISECTKYLAERQSVLSKFPTTVIAKLEKLHPAQRSIAITRLILLGTACQIKVEIPDFHTITLQYLVDIHRKRVV